jgi:hypothetical protein
MICMKSQLLNQLESALNKLELLVKTLKLWIKIINGCKILHHFRYFNLPLKLTCVQMSIFLKNPFSKAIIKLMNFFILLNACLTAF